MKKTDICLSDADIKLQPCHSKRNGTRRCAWNGKAVNELLDFNRIRTFYSAANMGAVTLGSILTSIVAMAGISKIYHFKQNDISENLKLRIDSCYDLLFNSNRLCFLPSMSDYDVEYKKITDIEKCESILTMSRKKYYFISIWIISITGIMLLLIGCI